MLFLFSMPVLIRHQWKLKTVVFLHRCLIHAVLLAQGEKKLKQNVCELCKASGLRAGIH